MWVDNIRMDLGEVGWGDVDWIDLAQALVNTINNLLVILNRQKFLSSCITDGLSRRAQLRGVSQSVESINCLFRGIYCLHLNAPKHVAFEWTTECYISNTVFFKISAVTTSNPKFFQCSLINHRYRFT
jgi:hypothetical protein